MRAVHKNLRISPKKLNLVADLVRRHSVLEAQDILKYTPKKAAGILLKAINSAVANAKSTFKQDAKNLVIEELIVGKATTLKRFQPVSRGRAHPILKRNSHLTVLLNVIEKGKSSTADPVKKETSEKASTGKSQEESVKTKKKPAAKKYKQS